MALKLNCVSLKRKNKTIAELGSTKKERGWVRGIRDLINVLFARPSLYFASLLSNTEKIVYDTVLTPLESRMKNTSLFCTLLLFACQPTFAAEKTLVKTCSTTLTMPGQPLSIETQIEVFKNGDSLIATVSQKSDGQASSYEDVVEFIEEKVQAGLTAELGDTENLNLAEKLIVHALVLTEDPVMENTYSAGFDLRKVRSAKVYTIGSPTNMGLTAVVEAKDESGNDLGSFFGGFLVSACK